MPTTLTFRRLVTAFALQYMDGDDGDPPANDPPPSDPPGDNKTYTKDDVEKIVQKRVKTLQAERTTMLAELKGLKESQSLTVEERDQLSQKIEDLENSMLTTQERAVKEKAKLEKQLASERDAIGKERDTWRQRFENAMISQALTDAAVQAEAVSATQLQQMFRSNARLVEGVDDAGKPTGVFSPVLEFDSVDEDGNSTRETLPVVDAIKRIKKDGLNANLFKHDGTPGTGQPGGGGNRSKKDPAAMPLPDQFPNHDAWEKAYTAWRDKYNTDGSEKKG